MRPRRRLVAALVAVSAALAAMVAPSGSATAADVEQAITATVDQVQVNRMGGITVSGSLDCMDQVAAIYGGAENIPAGTVAFVNMNWDALQYLGKSRTVTATYDSGIASICYADTTPGPYSWDTRYAYPVGTVQWVYSQDGKFAAGPIHVELNAIGTVEVPDLSDPPGEPVEYWLVDFSGWNLRATKVR